MFASPETLSARLASANYLANEGLSTAIFLALGMGKPLLLEGPPGVGKTEVALALANGLERNLVRLQCYEGIDAGHALYEWNYANQLLAIRQSSDRKIDLYSDDYLIERPLLRALRAADDTVLLIDEVDRADHEFEALLLEFLADYAISIPERGTVRASTPPVVILTSNRTRQLHEALRRRCLYHWIDYPEPDMEERIVMMRAGDVAAATAKAVVAAVNGLRRLHLTKAPGIAEGVEWAQAATLLESGTGQWPDAFRRSIGAVIKDEEDLRFLMTPLAGETSADPLDSVLVQACSR
ncbi:MAG: AAA family ATPase [Alphaproteobacteria bacterium]